MQIRGILDSEDNYNSRKSTMIAYKDGDLIEAAKRGEVDVIAHCCNCFNTLGDGIAQGIAEQIGKAFPEARSADSATIKGDDSKLGGFTKAFAYHGLDKGVAIYNLYGQYGYGRKGWLQPQELRKALAKMVEDVKLTAKVREYQGMKPEVVGINRIGCGRAGGNWSEVVKIVEEVCADINVVVYFHDG